MEKHLAQEPPATRRYRNGSDFVLHFKCVAAVAFVPVQQIDEGISALQTCLPPECQFFLDWVEDNYVGKENTAYYIYQYKHLSLVKETIQPRGYMRFLLLENTWRIW